jgi:hypothetical protein
MTYDLEERLDGTCLVIRLGGALTVADHRELLERIIDRIRHTGATSLLVDNRALTPAYDLSEAYFIVEGYVERRDMPRLATAIVCSPENRDRMRAFEDMAINRGFPVRTFESEEAARAWLDDA